jgi:hypothetical protein
MTRPSPTEAQPAVSGEMVERMARALASVDGGNPDREILFLEYEEPGHPNIKTGPAWKNFIKSARAAAIAALNHSTEAQGELASEIKAAIEAWHDCAPSGQGEGWAPDATEKFNAMATLLYENSETICAVLLRHPASVVENPFAGTTFETRAERAERLGVVEGDGLEAENKRLREALRQIEFRSTNHGSWFDQPGQQFAEYCKLGDIARAALASTVQPTQGEGNDG